MKCISHLCFLPHVLRVSDEENSTNDNENSSDSVRACLSLLYFDSNVSTPYCSIVI